MVPYSEHGIIEPEYKRLPVGEDIAESPVNQAMALVIENSPHPIIITEMSGKIHFFNSAAGEFVTTEEGAVLENFFDMDFGDKSKEILRKLTTEERDRTKKEETVEITNARGERRLLNIRIITFSEQFDKFRCYIFVDNT